LKKPQKSNVKMEIRYIFAQKTTKMADLRFSALREVFNRMPLEVRSPEGTISGFYGKNVFDLQKMERYLPKEAYLSVKTAIDEGSSINRPIADQVAIGLKAWAAENGATHYTHWFHPLTEDLLKHSQVHCWFSRNLMHQAFRAEA
jgi:glutamine synthetase type III